MIDLSGKRVLIFGLARTGIAVAEALPALGAVAVGHDSGTLASGVIERLERLGIPLIPTGEVETAAFDLCVATPAITQENPLALSLEKRGIPVISEVELAWLLARAPIGAVTGTNGKSTTTVLAGRMIEASGRRVFIGGNLSAEGYELPLVTAAMQASADDVIVAEVSSFQLERCFEFRPRCAALLNLTEDHLNRHRTMEAYAAAKMRLFQSQTGEDTAILGWDDPRVRGLSSGIAARRMCFSGREPVENGAFLEGDRLLLRSEGETHLIANTSELALWAWYDRLNILAAACVAHGMGASLEGVRSAATKFTGLSDRMEDCGEIGGVRWLNNSMCTNPAAGRAAILATAQRGPVILIAGGARKGLDYTEWGGDAATVARTVVLYGDDAEILQLAIGAGGQASVMRVADLREAMRVARDQARPGDCVVLAPAMASFDQFGDFHERGVRFREIVDEFRTEAEQ